MNAALLGEFDTGEVSGAIASDTRSSPAPERKTSRKQVPRVCADGRMNEAAAADYLGCSRACLRAWRARGTGPNYVAINRVWYFQDDLDLFIRKHYRDPAE